MSDELYINGERVDMGKDTAVTLEFKSNLLSDISKIVCSRSYTINLPKTVLNMRVLDNPNIPTYGSQLPYKYYPARYLRNGIEIINGQAVLIGCSDKYEVALVWGMSTTFQTWAKNSTSLKDFPDNGDYVFWGLGQHYAKPGEGDVLFSLYITGIDVIPPPPCVRVRWLLDKIKPEGITFRFPDDRKQVIDKLLIPLTTRNDSKILGDHDFAWLQLGSAHGDGRGSILSFQKMMLPTHEYYTKPSFTDNNKYVDGLIIKVENLQLQISIDLSINYNTGYSNYLELGDVKIVLFCGNTEIASFPPASVIRGSVDGDTMNVTYHISFNVEDTPIGNVGNNGEKLQFIIVSSKPGEAKGGDTGTGSIKLFPSVSEVSPSVDGVSGGWFPVIPNLPDIKFIDFVKAICAMVGVFAVYNPANPNTISFTSVDDLIKNKKNALDWSDRLILSSGRGEPKSVTYKLSDFAQVNKFNYKDDEAVTDKNGSLFVDNATIEYKKDAINLPFAASEGDQVILYRRNPDDRTKIESVKVQPRILLEYNRGGVSGASFNGLEFSTLIKKYYNAYQSLIRKPVVIKDLFRLNEVDLKTIDFTIPVYLRQYGRYYAIISVQVNPSGISECELLQLPLIK